MLGQLASLEALKAFADAFAYPIVITRGPLIATVNTAWLSILGFSRAEVEGRPFIDFMPPEERSRIARRAALRAAQPDKYGFSAMTSLALKADGRATVVHVQPTVIPTADGEPYIINVVFVVPERDAEIDLAELLVATSSSLVKARTIQEVRQMAVGRLADGGCAAAFFRHDGSTIYPVGATLPDHVRQDDLEEAIVHERAVFIGPELALPSAIIVPVVRGTEPEILSLAGPRLVTPLRAAVKLFAQGVASALDTAALIVDLERRNRELSETRAELVRHERLAALGEMAASIAHEVRNPVGVIGNAVTTLRRHHRDDLRRDELFSIIDEECLRLARIVRDLLDFSRPRQLTFTFEPLHEIAEEAIAAAASQPDVAERGARFELDERTSAPSVRVDRDRLRQALVNLMLNAVQANPDGGTVVVRVGITHRGSARIPSISVIDQGGGIPPDVVDRIFDPFFTTRAQGSGLGLAIVRTVVDELRAEVHLDNRVGQGATFTLEFG